MATSAREQSALLAGLLRREHLALSEFLVALAAFDAARGWVELGYRSLFELLLRELGLPKGPAYYRMIAAGLIQRYPEVVEPLRDGRLNLTSVTQLAKVITPENRAEVLPRFFNLSKREAKEVVAEIAPAAAPPVRTVVTAERPPAHPASTLLPAPPVEVLPEEPTSIEPGLSSAPTPAHRQRTQVEPLTAERSRLHVTVSRRLLDKLAAARDALSHSHPGASEETILEVGLDLILERHAKRRGIGAKPSPPKGEKRSPRSRHVPAQVWRAVWERDGGRCAWPLENGGVCGSTDQLELDHVKGWARGAGTTVDECRILCRWHQDVSARRLYGDDHMNAYTRPKGGTCSEPVAEYGAAAARARHRRPSKNAPGRWRRVTAGSGSGAPALGHLAPFDFGAPLHRRRANGIFPVFSESRSVV
ncbi:MAG TPA: HNH endonuclease signature motif containing protein [Thermoanaerobaculia bacterium]